MKMKCVALLLYFPSPEPSAAGRRAVHLATCHAINADGIVTQAPRSSVETHLFNILYMCAKHECTST